MDTHRVRDLLEDLLTRLGFGDVDREPIRIRSMCGLERLRLPDGRTVIFKYSRGPLTDEHLILRHVSAHGLPVPRLLAAATVYDVQARADSLGMVLEDLGEPARQPTTKDAAAAAAAIHRIPKLPGRPGIDSATLAGLPARALRRLSVLQDNGRWRDPRITRQLETLARTANVRCHDAELPPFGTCNSDFRPGSVRIGGDGRWRVLDMARSSIGPGLLDLASWQGTTTAPDIDAFHELLAAYVRAGGAPTVFAARAGLSVAQWAIGWHRLRVITWYLEQAARWMPEPERDEITIPVVHRHLAEAIEMLGA